LAAQEGLRKAKADGDEKAIAEWEAQIETIEENIWELEGEVETAWGDTL
jgi:archaellum component FlaC